MTREKEIRRNGNIAYILGVLGMAVISDNHCNYHFSIGIPVTIGYVMVVASIIVLPVWSVRA